MLLPPLRDRPTDIPLLASEFLKNFNKENERALAFEPGSIDLLKGCSFPGNVRELENCVRRTATLAAGPAITESDFACHQDECLSSILWKGHSEPAPQRPRPEIPLQVLPRTPVGEPLSTVARAPAIPAPARSEPESDTPMSERDRLVDAMERAGWVQAKAARILGLTPRQIGYALKKHDIEVKHF
jgi:Nif-specific regulatory protein